MKNLTADNRQNTRSMVQTAIFGSELWKDNTF